MSDTSGLQNADAEGVPAEDQPERFEGGDHDAQASEPAETEPGQDVSDAGETGVTPEGAQDVTPEADQGGDGAEPPPAEFDPAQQPSNPDLVKNTEPPD
ncbi:hypothetical protein [Leifsonia aquatica]|uniref:hypothetical protein n=1 Tax=Leifsonia aquatica TaxID=144185 RepID=UPI0028A916A6|nr:hypothetical protein [Leifsonia aquatica]